MSTRALPTQPARPGLVSGRVAGFVRTYWVAAIFLVGVLGLWELAVRVLGIPAFLLPPPSAIGATLVDRAGVVLGDGWFTFKEAVAGWIIGCGMGFLTAVLTTRFRALADGLLPFAVATNSVPIIAFAPLVVAWFSFDWPSKVAIVAVLTFFPTMVATFKGLTSCAAQSLELMHSYAATPRQVFLKVRLPSSLPLVFSALKVCAALSMIGAVVGEFFGGTTQALGVFIISEAAISHTVTAWAAIVVACLFGLVFYLAIVAIERLSMPWHLSFRS
ncbi:MAG: ABC transporter permease [Chloroflexota bacterium]